LKFVKPNKVVNAADKFGSAHDVASTNDLRQLGERVIAVLNDEDLKVSEVHPFFWSLVETYVDRFQQYPFDINKAIISYLEFKDYPEDTVRELIKHLEAQFEIIHGRPLRKPTQLVSKRDVLDDEIKQLRDSLKYAAMVAESGGSK
jgi:hypothetical protein